LLFKQQGNYITLCAKCQYVFTKKFKKILLFEQHSDIIKKKGGDKMKIGEKIKLRRIEKGWSLQELADRMGYANKSTVARIESGKIDPPQSKVVKFASALDTSVADLMGWIEGQEITEKPTESDELSENIKKLDDFAKSVPDDKVELVLKVMKSIVEDD
jgi:transcriptional regulator with XRE-family HTH domain